VRTSRLSKRQKSKLSVTKIMYNFQMTSKVLSRSDGVARLLPKSDPSINTDVKITKSTNHFPRTRSHPSHHLIQSTHLKRPPQRSLHFSPHFPPPHLPMIFFTTPTPTRLSIIYGPQSASGTPASASKVGQNYRMRVQHLHHKPCKPAVAWKIAGP
jgi:hypothetical protein